MKASEIRRKLRHLSRKGALCDGPERALLAILELKPYRDPINADYTKGAKIQLIRVIKAIEEVFSG